MKTIHRLEIVVAESDYDCATGLLEIQADGVTAAYKAQGLPEPRRIIDGEWAALVWDSVK